ncbi:MAG TPA: ABC transporter permease [Mycobacteriales bacterium]|nr:ABC transporter permease [Mycobacteriales bacterium]
MTTDVTGGGRAAGPSRPADAVVPADPAPAPRRRRGPRLSTLLGASALLLTLAIVAVVPLLPQYDVQGQDLSNALAPPFRSSTHLLGTDELGRDTLSRLSAAGLTSLRIALPALAISVVLGVTLGLLAGYFGRAANAVIMGVADLQLSIPLLILLIMVVTIVGPSPTTLTVVLGCTYWMGYGRVARVHALTLGEREFVQAARTFGASDGWIIRKHLLPKLVPQLAIMASFDLGVIVILEAGLSYLGLGVQPPTPSWGGMILTGQNYLQTNAWLAVFPGLAIFLLVGGVQVLSRRFTREDSPGSQVQLGGQV